LVSRARTFAAAVASVVCGGGGGGGVRQTIVEGWQGSTIRSESIVLKVEHFRQQQRSLENNTRMITEAFSNAIGECQFVLLLIAVHLSPSIALQAGNKMADKDGGFGFLDKSLKDAQRPQTDLLQ